MRIVVEKTIASYPLTSPFHPHKRYPEYQFESISDSPNYTYEAVRKSLYNLDLDRDNYESPQWNPFKNIAKKNTTIVIKPNFVNNFSFLSEEPNSFAALVTNVSVIRCIIDYILIACGHDVNIIIADLPIQIANMNDLHIKTGLDRMINFYKEQDFNNISFLDLRTFYLDVNKDGSVNNEVKLNGDPNGYVAIDLKSESSFLEFEGQEHLFKTPGYEGRNTYKCHTSGSHLYILPKTILSADLFINVPKMKVHCKSGVTLSLKNLVGIIGDKSCLPHYRKGSPSEGGDEYPLGTNVKRLKRELSFRFQKMGPIVWRIVRPIGRCLRLLDNLMIKGKIEDTLRDVGSGDWFGNDTIWRMIHDLNKIIIYADKDGNLHSTPQRQYISFIDGIIAGEGEGPLRPMPLSAGLIVVSKDPVAADIVSTKLMGLDWKKIHKLVNINNSKYKFSNFYGTTEDLEIIFNGNKTDYDGCPIVSYFKPATGWRGHIELRG